jgi:hypothetical protein
MTVCVVRRGLNWKVLATSRDAPDSSSKITVFSECSQAVGERVGQW